MKTTTSIIKDSPRFSLRLAPALVIAALIACCPLQTRANTIALSFTSYDTGDAAGNFTFAWAFTLSSPILLTDLGVFDPAGLGLSESHFVTVWTSNGIQEAQGTVPFGTSAPITSGFRYVSLSTPVLLLAGNYTIGAY